LIQERTLPRIDKVLAIAGRDDRTGDVIVKVLNSAPEPALMSIGLTGTGGIASGAVTVLTGGPLEENTFEAPTTIVPRTSPLAGSGSKLTHTFPPHSLSILRLRTR
jgi:alpha-L-arabinofuranosidase